jgi:RNA polymerase sigma-70 factor (ECF subfamily)
MNEPQGITPRHTEFARVYEENVWSVYGFLAYRIDGIETVEDLTQATFERALRAWSRFDPRKAPVRTWLFAIARNLLIDHRRTRRGELTQPIDDAILPAIPGPEGRHAASSELIDALSQLSEREREVLALRYGGDLTGPEIARLLDLSLANVQQLTSRALRKLRGLLEPSYSAPVASSHPSAISANPPPA